MLRWTGRIRSLCQGAPAFVVLGVHVNIRSILTCADTFLQMVHNGIEQGHLSILAEAHYLLHHTVGLENKEVADIFDEWNGTNAKGGEDQKAGEGEEGKELYDNFLLKVRVLSRFMYRKSGD